MIDIHSHLLPNLDDGVTSFGQSIEIIRGLSEVGVTDLILTPHYVPESKWCSPKKINQQKLDALVRHLFNAGVKMRVYLGNEIYINSDIVDLIKNGTVSTLANSKYVLVELPMSGEWAGFEDVLLLLKQKGFKPILAHPERYSTSAKDISYLYELASAGVLFQCNLGSIVGQYGRKPKKVIKKLAKANLIWCFGTDIHHARNYGEIIKAKKKLRHYYTEEDLNDLLVNNPRRILQSRARK